MTRRIALAGSLALGGVVLAAGAGRLAAAPSAAPLVAHQDPLLGHLLYAGDRVQVAYKVETKGVAAPTGTLYVRNDLTRRFERLALKPGGRQTARAVVPQRLIRGAKLLYYAVVRDPASGRAATVPKAGARAPDYMLVVSKSIVVRLGTHRFGRPRSPDAVVARTGPLAVGWQLTSPAHGPQTFVVSRDGWIWLADGLQSQVLGWRPGRPGVVARRVSLPLFQDGSDLALGPAGTFYALRGLPSAPPRHPVGRMVLDRLAAKGLVWQSELAGVFSASEGDLSSNTPLRIGPDSRLYVVAGTPGSIGSESGWRPAATATGRQVPVAAQRAGDLWPAQPVAGGLRLFAQSYPTRMNRPPREVRYALVDSRDRVVRAWRIVSGTDLTFGYATPEVVGGDPVVVLDVTAGTGRAFKWEHVVLRLGPGGMRTYFSLGFDVWGETVLADVRVGPDGSVYQLATSPKTGVAVRRYSLASAK